MQLPAPATLLAMAVVALGLLALHLVATHGTGTLDGPVLAVASISPSTTLSLWWHHLWAGFFHRSWGHLAYNLAVLVIAFPFAVRQQGPWLTLANAYWIGPFTVFTLHLLVVLPLASAGLPYAVKALEIPLVGFSVMAYSMAGMALTLAPPPVAVASIVGLVLYETALALCVTAPFIGVYHVVGFGMGFWVRTLLLRS
ncbi:MAG TPA: hypothetical protein VM327_01660 [Candidatus Thermoplasmatota archaeon]|nr:hypothetical protein [Candidatus Thermoplasmatota archaeon]